MPRQWDSFLLAADEWIINYALPPMMLHSVKLFSIGHALELYLKAAYTKLSGNIDEAIEFRHDIPKIWAACKTRDSAFLPQYELREVVLARDLLSVDHYSTLEKPDLMHFLQNQELYVVAKYLADLKYLGAPLKQIEGAYAVGYSFPNPRWIILFRALREYLA
ncbi:MAG TPA: hypothetical protein VJ123_07725 [Anaerolineales bacterium]|nr:hypothetical protein [Anaerolineales bacterium]